MKGKIAVIGSFVTDFIFKTPRRPVKGETIIGTSFELAMGGKGANQAMMAALLGADVSMIGRVGNDSFGDMQIENMKKAGVNTEFIIKDSQYGTGSSGIVLDAEGDNSIVFIPLANNAVSKEDFNNALPAVQEADAVLVQLELPLKVNLHAVVKSKKLGRRVILDPAPACALEDDFYKNSDIMTPNETEAAILSGIEVIDAESAEKAARIISSKGCPTVIITLGANGSLVLDQDKAAHYPAPKINAVDSTAAGDAFTGSLAVFLSEGRPLDEAVQLAGFCGALTASKLGAQPSLPSRSDVAAFAAKHGIDFA